MADRNSHIKQWKHNRDLLGLIPSSHPDWLVTVSFYTALHAIDALLASDKVERVNSHDARNHVLMQTNRYSDIYRHYGPLFALSRTIRYLADPARWVPFDQIEKNILRRYLFPIERSVQRLTGLDLSLPPIPLAAS